MKNVFNLFLLLNTILIGPTICQAQEEEAQHETEEVEAPEGKHFVALAFGYTYIPKGASLNGSEAEGVFVPSFGLDYFHLIGRRWELGVMLDLELGHYLIFSKELERENAFIATLMATHKLVNWHIQGGIGVEFEKNENLMVLRLGLERPFHLGNHWVLAPAVYFDIKEGYDTWSISLSIGKSF